MIVFLNVDEIGLRGLSILFSSAKLKEVELADDMDNLNKAKLDISHFVRILAHLLTRIN